MNFGRLFWYSVIFAAILYCQYSSDHLICRTSFLWMLSFLFYYPLPLYFFWIFNPGHARIFFSSIKSFQNFVAHVIWMKSCLNVSTRGRRGRPNCHVKDSAWCHFSYLFLRGFLSPISFPIPLHWEYFTWHFDQLLSRLCLNVKSEIYTQKFYVGH